MAEAKHSFVDDNPYLVYSPKAETTSEGGSGGGGDTSIFKITDDSETGALSVKAGELATMCDSGIVILTHGHFENGYTDGYNVSLLISALAHENSYTFDFAEFSALGESPVYFSSYTASSADDYPIYDEGD